jgi:NAD(P)-dependent dehydrogenase (short-subunit alcohol dehydrogenase family)
MEVEVRFENKVAVVTGGASGIGLATAQRLGAEGARVVVADLAGDKAEAAAQQLRADGAPDALGVACDVSVDKEVKRAIQMAGDRFGGLDVVVNNAGLMIFRRIEELSREDWLRVLGVDLLGAFYFTREAFLHMKAGGAIVNVASVHAVETQPLVAAYAAAKAALVSLTRSSALEGKPKGIRVNAVLPGAVDTPMLWDNPNVKAGLERLQRSDVGKPEDIASVIAYLASEDACFVQGASVEADGGRLATL